jgi:hypothetical protein
VRIDAEQEIAVALREELRFQLSRPVIVLLGTVPLEGDMAGHAAREVISRMCAEVISPLARQHHLTVVTEEDGTSARLVAARALAREIGPNHYLAVAILMGGGESMWNNLRTVVRAGFPLIIVAGSGGIADEIAQVHAYQRELHRPYVWSVEPTPVAPFPIETLDLRAAGFLSLYAEHGMSVTVYTGTDDSAWLHRRLKGEFNIHTKD